MARYPFAWLPIFIVLSTAVLLTNAYLALIAFAILALVVLGALAAAIVAVPYVLGRYAVQRWRAHAVTHASAPRVVSARRQEAGAR